MTKPLPCPFCGYSGKLEITGLSLSENIVALQIQCICGAMGPTVSMTRDKADSGVGFPDVQTAWNRRMKPAPIPTGRTESGTKPPRGPNTKQPPAGEKGKPNA